VNQVVKLVKGEFRPLHHTAVKLRVTCDCCAAEAACELGEAPLYLCDAHRNVDVQTYAAGFLAKYGCEIEDWHVAELAARAVRP